MDRIECPRCQTSYTFARVGITPPNDPNTTAIYVTTCSACRAVFETKVAWQSLKTRHRENWLMQTILRRPPSTEYVFRVRARSKEV